MKEDIDLEFKHQPVLLQQVLTMLRPFSGGVYIDGTLGGAGHAGELLRCSSPKGFLLGVDRDGDALKAAEKHLAAYAGRWRLVQDNYCNMLEAASAAGISGADGILLDIGVSSYQLDKESRGFSYNGDAPLDMRMDQSRGITAAEVVNSYSQEQLAQLIFDFSEERWARRIAEFIVREREAQPILTTAQLTALIKRAIPAGAREKDQHPARRTFQALRIEVNGELAALEKGLDAAMQLLKPGGRLAVITFHSLEDRIVKGKFKLQSQDCICPPGLPVCVCGHKAQVTLVNKKPLTANEDELAGNPRSRSAKLRVVEKLPMRQRTS